MSMPLLVLVIVTLVLLLVLGFAEYVDARMDIAHGGSYVVTDVYRSYVGLLIGIGSLVALADAVSTFMM